MSRIFNWWRNFHHMKLSERPKTEFSPNLASTAANQSHQAKNQRNQIKKLCFSKIGWRRSRLEISLRRCRCIRIRNWWKVKKGQLLKSIIHHKKAQNHPVKAYLTERFYLKKSKNYKFVFKIWKKGKLKPTLKKKNNKK